MTSIETILGMLLAAFLIALIAKRWDLPYSIALVVGGLLLAFVPHVPRVTLDPQIVFFLLLPPILAEAAFYTSWRDFWRLRRPILLLAFGLVTVTSTFVAILCVTFIPGMSWSVGFLIGAIISPPDAAAATSITRGMKLPKRVVQILEGESLVNDASGLTLYRFAVMSIAGAGFSWQQAAGTFLWIVFGGIAIGAALGYGLVRIFRYLRDPEIEVLSTFLVTYLSYFTAEQVHASGVMATVATGLILGWHAPEIFTANTRIRGFAVWQTVVFLINASVFLLIGLQIPLVLEGLSGYPPEMLIGWSLVLLTGVIVIRLLWVFPAAYLPAVLSPCVLKTEGRPDWRGVAVVGWTGLRGVVSLAAALALPLETERGLPFPYRNLIVLLTFAVIVGTLLIQGLSLRVLVRRLKLPEDTTSEEEVLQARIHTTEVVLDRVLELEARGECTGAALSRIRGYYEDRLVSLRAELEAATGTEKLESPQEFQSLHEQKLWWKLVQIERNAVVEMRRQMKIGDEAMHEVERDIDLLEARITPRAN
jgi:monovalent cation/hydrogen antiporter